MPDPPIDLLSSRPEFAGVPYVDQYVGEWALWEPHARVLLGQAENLNIQLHLEQHAVRSEECGAGNRSRQTAVDSARSEERGSTSGLRVTSDGIAVIELRGMLMKQASSMSDSTSTVAVRRQVRAAAASSDVNGILLVIDSPGGTVAGTMDLAADLRAAAAKKPLFAHIEDIGASAAYWQAAQAQRISAGPSALVGSIGVFTVVYDLSKNAEQQGVQVHVVRFGALKGAGTPGSEITEEQLAKWQQLIDGRGNDFIAAVAAGRRLPSSTVRELATGDVWKGAEAQTVRLVDAIESLDETLAALVAATKKQSPRPRIQTMSETQSTAVLESTAATLAELKAACPGAASDFLLDQLERSATVPQAMQAWAKRLSDENAALVKQRDELQAAADKAVAETKTQRGVAPLGSAAKGEESGAYGGLTAAEFCRLEIDKRKLQGMSHEQAFVSVRASHPKLMCDLQAEAESHRKNS